MRLARLSLETYVRQGHILQTLPEDLPAELTGQTAGAFVSLHKDGRLRGCIGTIAPTEENVAKEIVQNAVSAGTRDPRFPPVRIDELDRLEYSVDVLGKPEPVDSPAALDPKRYGVIVTHGQRARPAAAPTWTGWTRWTSSWRLPRRKGGIRAEEPYTLQRFEVVRHL